MGPVANASASSVVVANGTKPNSACNDFSFKYQNSFILNKIFKRKRRVLNICFVKVGFVLSGVDKFPLAEVIWFLSIWQLNLQN